MRGEVLCIINLCQVLWRRLELFGLLVKNTMPEGSSELDNLGDVQQKK